MKQTRSCLNRKRKYIFFLSWGPHQKLSSSKKRRKRVNVLSRYENRRYIHTHRWIRTGQDDSAAQRKMATGFHHTMGPQTHAALRRCDAETEYWVPEGSPMGEFIGLLGSTHRMLDAGTRRGGRTRACACRCAARIVTASPCGG